MADGAAIPLPLSEGEAVNKDDKVITTIKIELPKEVYDQLDDIFWVRLTGLVVDVFRLSQPQETIYYPGVWRER